MANPLILGVASPFWDRTATVSEEFLKAQGFELEVTSNTPNEEEVDACWETAKKQASQYSHSFSLGGTGTNVIKTLARLGRNCGIHGKKGTSASGEKAERRLQRLGIIPYLVESSKPAGKVNCFISEEGKRTMQTFIGASGDFSKEDINEEHFRSASYVHLEGYAAYSLGVLPTSVEYAVRHKARISLDLASPSVIKNFKPEFLALIGKIDIIFGNMGEFIALTGKSEVEEIASKFSFRQIAVITDGENGCWVKDAGENKAVHYPAFEVPKEKIIATTGAGDFFAGGFLNGIMLGLPIETSVEMGHLAASKVIQVAEAELTNEGWAELKQEIEKIVQVAEERLLEEERAI